MPQITITMDEKVNKIVRKYMVDNDLKSKETAILSILKKKGNKRGE